MTRHFFALLALLTGLAALGSPAQASLTEALACDSSIAAATDADNSQKSEIVAAQPVPVTIHASSAVEQPLAAPVPPEALRLPVLMGIDRAHE